MKKLSLNIFMSLTLLMPITQANATGIATIDALGLVQHIMSLIEEIMIYKEEVNSGLELSEQTDTQNNQYAQMLKDYTLMDNQYDDLKKNMEALNILGEFSNSDLSTATIDGYLRLLTDVDPNSDDMRVLMKQTGHGLADDPDKMKAAYVKSGLGSSAKFNQQNASATAIANKHIDTQKQATEDEKLIKMFATKRTALVGVGKKLGPKSAVATAQADFWANLVIIEQNNLLLAQQAREDRNRESESMRRAAAASQSLKQEIDRMTLVKSRKYSGKSAALSSVGL